MLDAFVLTGTHSADRRTAWLRLARYLTGYGPGPDLTAGRPGRPGHRAGPYCAF